MGSVRNWKTLFDDFYHEFGFATSMGWLHHHQLEKLIRCWPLTRCCCYFDSIDLKTTIDVRFPFYLMHFQFLIYCSSSVNQKRLSIHHFSYTTACANDHESKLTNNYNKNTTYKHLLIANDVNNVKICQIIHVRLTSKSELQ